MNYKIIGKKKFENEIIDTLVLARDKFPGSQGSLDAFVKDIELIIQKELTYSFN